MKGGMIVPIFFSKALALESIETYLKGLGTYSDLYFVTF